MLSISPNTGIVSRVVTPVLFGGRAFRPVPSNPTVGTRTYPRHGRALCCSQETPDVLADVVVDAALVAGLPGEAVEFPGDETAVLEGLLVAVGQFLW